MGAGEAAKMRKERLNRNTNSLNKNFKSFQRQSRRDTVPEETRTGDGTGERGAPDVGGLFVCYELQHRESHHPSPQT